MLTDTYPDNLTAHYAYNQVGMATGIKYEKNAYCASKCPETWFEDSIVPSVHGETLEQSSTLAKENYTYDNDGRLIETQETPTGKDCTAHLYAYDEESNRTSETTRESGTETCPTEGGTVESHSYDSANALIDAGVSYEAFGNTTKLPASDAGKYELDSSYYVDGQVATQEQQEAEHKTKALSYTYDPEGRTEETETTIKESGKETHEPIAISNYAGPGEMLAWSGQEENKKWSRDVPGIDGALDATQTSAGENILQLHDLQGDIVGTVGLSETETKLSTRYNSTEFGVPSEGKPAPRYAWLGAGGVSSELPSSGVVTQGGSSYVPQVARSLQTAPVIPPGACPDGCGSGGTYVALVPVGLAAGAAATADQAVAEAAAALQKAEQREAEINAKLALVGSGAGSGSPGEGGLCEGAMWEWCISYAIETGQIEAFGAEGEGASAASYHPFCQSDHGFASSGPGCEVIAYQVYGPHHDPDAGKCGKKAKVDNCDLARIECDGPQCKERAEEIPYECGEETEPIFVYKRNQVVCIGADERSDKDDQDPVPSSEYEDVEGY